MLVKGYHKDADRRLIPESSWRMPGSVGRVDGDAGGGIVELRGKQGEGTMWTCEPCEGVGEWGCSNLKKRQEARVKYK